MEAVGEYRVVTSSASAEYGRGAGAQVQLIYKSGTNEFHGSVFDFHRNRALNANSFANNKSGIPRAAFIRNQFGASVGGPIIKSRAFFNFTYEGIRQKQESTINALVYTPMLKTGIFRYYTKGANSNTLVDKNGKPTVAAGDISTINLLTVDSTRLGKDSSGMFDKLVGSFPAPNNYEIGDGFNSGGFRYVSPNPFTQNQWVLKGDYVFTDKHRLGISYSNLHYNNPGTKLLSGSLEPNYEQYPSMILSLNSAFTNHFLNEFRLGGTERNANFENTDVDRFKPEGMVVFDGLTSAATSYGAGRGHPKDIFLPQYFPTAQITTADNFTWIKGNHSLRGGVDIRVNRSNVAFGGDQYFPVIETLNSNNPANIPALTGLNSTDRVRAAQFTNDITGTLGLITQQFNANSTSAFTPFESKIRGWRQREYSYFFQDTWKFRPTISLNLGMRYEMMFPVFEAHDLYAYPQGDVNGFLGISGTGGETKLGLADGGGRKVFKKDWNNFGPNVGFNWDPTGQGKWSVSGNYRISYDRVWIATTLFMDFDNEGMSTVRSLNGASGQRLSQLPTLFNSKTGYFDPGKVFGPKTFDRQGLVNFYDPGYYTPYTGSWSLRVQREILRNTVLSVAYVGNKATGQARALNMNQIELRKNGFMTGFLAAQQNLAANGDPLKGGDTGVFGKLWNVMSTSDRNGQLSNISTGQVASVAELIDRTRSSSQYLEKAGMPLNFFRLNPQFQNAWLVGNNSYSTWNGLKVEVNRRFLDGLQFDMNYTFGKGLTDYKGGQSQRAAYRDNLNHDLDKGPTSIDSTHVINANFIWDLPFGSGKRWLRNSHAILDGIWGGWQYNGIFNYASGRPITASSGRNTLIVGASDADCQKCDPEMTTKVIKGDTIRGLTVDEAKLFTYPGAGSPGLTGLRYFRGSSYAIFDSSIFKQFKLRFIPGEESALQLRFEFFNTFNHNNFGSPTLTLTSSNFGVISAPTGFRIIQMAMKFIF